ncbi:hypothetical protein CY34DRAFT_429183 [Suillus luteus UH-Slu-Lm8-n1]|uniref:Uncharacterized protein n=1 Tax=Suillus luteus UH-Slu-Lm8-n1 TaxID=930992 RepID=A0A0D0C252_9AGAM|nr:hypothetical protein CY34DRAFT_429183 [Suillus luteus UH-Slu-Lm8-n1]
MTLHRSGHPHSEHVWAIAYSCRLWRRQIPKEVLQLSDFRYRVLGNRSSTCHWGMANQVNQAR